jgi:hypothetical protein
MVWSHN